MTSSSSKEILERIHSALEAARTVLNRFTPGAIATEYKVGLDPVTEADRAVDEVLRKTLLRDGEGWLSEETVDDFTRLDKQRVWVVDPLDGTREFVEGVPEFCVSIAMVENGIPVAGGICNPATDELILGSLETHAAEPTQRSPRRARACQPQRSEARRVEEIRVRRVQHQADGIGSLQTRTGRRRPRGPYFHISSKE
jgi:myo-inositol-1(or 4)-monophosphatase